MFLLCVHSSPLESFLNGSFTVLCLSCAGLPSTANGTNWMRKVEVENGDVVGIAIQQSDLPMVQFFLNGEPLHESAVNRFRGTVYPAVCLPESAADTLKISPVVAEEDFKCMSPGPKFGPIIVARSIV
jgi:hypothetical protein